MNSFRDLLSQHLASAPSGEWIIQIEGEMITLFHKDDRTIALLHFPRSSLDAITLLMNELYQTFAEKVES